MYARTLLVTGKTDDSLAIAAELAGRHDEVEVQLQYAELLLSAGRPREAETRLNEILADNPGLPEATRALAFLAMTEQRIDDAKRYFNDLRGEPNYRSEAFYYLGPHRRDGARFPAGDALVRARHGRHACRRGATAHGAHPVRASRTTAKARCAICATSATANPRFATDMLVAQAQLLLQMEQPDGSDARRSTRRSRRRPTTRRCTPRMRSST